jgi:hypothetical protein
MDEPMTEREAQCALAIAGPWLVSEAEYFADVHFVSNSMLRVFSQSIPAYHQRFVARTKPSPKPSAEMRLGFLLHARLLDENAWVRDVRGDHGAPGGVSVLRS